MSTFKVSIEIIKEVKNHPNADRLDICNLEGMDFRFITGRDQFKSGDKVVYFPIDSVLPENIISYLGLTGKLAGKDKNRVKTIKLRNELSEGVVTSLDLVNCNSFDFSDKPIGFDLTEHLEVTKYEPPVQITQDGKLNPISGIGLSIYDIEGADRYTNIAELLMDIPVVITEKLEGMNFSCGICNGKFIVAQRTAFIEELEGKEHFFWKTAREMNLEEKCFNIQSKYFPGKNVFLRGEIIGEKIQGNIYGLKGQTIKFFDLIVDGVYQNVSKFWDATSHFGIPIVPTIAAHADGVKSILEIEGKSSIKELSNGPSSLNPDVLREGIVIRPFEEQNIQGFGRLLLKQRSPLYLASSEF